MADDIAARLDLMEARFQIQQLAVRYAMAMDLRKELFSELPASLEARV